MEVSFMISNERLGELYSITVETADTVELVELTSVSVSKDLQKEIRILQFIEEINNPYCFLVGNNIVKTQFSNSGLTLKNALVKSSRK